MFISVTAQAQDYDTTQYFSKMNYVFQQENKTHITTGRPAVKLSYHY